MTSGRKRLADAKRRLMPVRDSGSYLVTVNLMGVQYEVFAESEEQAVENVLAYNLGAMIPGSGWPEFVSVKERE